jgi:hypothetical protein
MPSVALPKAARGAVFVALLIALVSGISVRSGPIMLLGVCIVSLLAAAGILLRRVWSAYGFALLLALSILAMIFFAVTGQNSGSFFQILVGVILYSAVAGLFVLAGLSLKVAGAKQGTPVPWILIALLFSVPFIFYRPVAIADNRMAPVLLAGDFLLADRFAHPAAGDLIAFHDAKNKREIRVGRVAGLAGKDQYEVAGFGLIDAGDLVGKPKFVYDSLAADPADDPSQPLHAPLRRWDRVFKAL